VRWLRYLLVGHCANYSKFRFAVEGVDGSKYRFPQENGILRTLSDPVFYRTLMNQAKSLGISIRELHHILTPQEVMQMVRSGIGISFSTQALARSVHAPGIICRPLVPEQLVLLRDAFRQHRSFVTFQ
jgi:hypothetical protein